LIKLQSAAAGDAFIKAVFGLLKCATPCDFVNVCLRIVQQGGAGMAYRMIDSRGRNFGPELLAGAFSQEHPGMPTLMAHPGISNSSTRGRSSHPMKFCTPHGSIAK
jgi:hypothetical protein